MASSVSAERAESATRVAIVAEALSWTGTPFHHAQCVKGVGVDCAHLLIGVYSALGLVPAFKPDPYPKDWHVHRNEERFLQTVERFARPTERALPGDVALYRFGRCVSHGAIVLNDDFIIHAYVEAEAVERLERDVLEHRLVGYWSVL